MRDVLLRYDICSLGFVAGVALLVVRSVEGHFPLWRYAMRAFMAAGVVGTAAYGYVAANPASDAELLGLLAVSIIGGQAAALSAILVVPPAAGTWRVVRRWSGDLQRSFERRAEARQDAARAATRELAWERGRPERERQERERAEQDRDAAASRARREDARSECLLYFHLHAPEFGSRFGRAQFDEYVRQYLRDDMPPEAVDQQAARLRGLMEGHLGKAGVREKPTDIAALAAWFKETKARIEAQEVEPRLKKVQLAKLAERYAELVQEHIEDMKP